MIRERNMENIFNVIRFIIIPYNSNPLNRFNHMESTMNGCNKYIHDSY